MLKSNFDFRNTLFQHEGGELDFQKLLGKFPGFPWSKYPKEKHLALGKVHNFTGAQTNLTERLNPDDTPKPDSIPVNRVDQAAYRHDIFYRDHDNLEERHEADRRMIQELKSIQNPTFREKVERALVIKALQVKLKLGIGLTLADEIHKQYRKPKHLLKVKVFEKDDIWSADLIVMPPERGFKFVLTVIDLYTRFAWAIPLKNKTGISVKSAFEEIFKNSNRQPKKLWVDKGKEFYNSEVKSLPFEIYSTENDGKAVVIERLNRTLKSMMFKKFTELGEQKWLKLLPEIIHHYNNKVHSSIGMTPHKASENPEKLKDKNTEEIYENETNREITKRKPKFKVGDRVRIFKWKSKFAKGYTGYWTTEIFKIEKVNNTAPYTYELVDLKNEEITGRFYENELQKTDF